MPFVFNNQNLKLQEQEIYEAEQEARKLKALGKELEKNTRPVEQMVKFTDRFGWMPPDVLAGLGIASLTNPGLNLSEQEPFVRDLVNAWVKNNQENANRVTASLKGAIRTAFVGFDGAAESFIKRPIQAAGGVYAGENINPTAALLDIIPGLGFTLVKGLGMTDMSYSEFFAKREQKLQQLGGTVAGDAIRELSKGNKVNLGTGFFGNSTLAEDTDVYQQIAAQTSDERVLENARQLIQDQLGEPISVNERKRVNANTFKFDDGTVRPISPGLLLAQNILTPDEKGYNALSGLVDGIFTIGLDPANLAGGYLAKAGRLKRALNPDVVKNRFLTGRLARKMVHVPEGRKYLQTPAVREIAEIGAKSKDLQVQRMLVKDQIKDPKILKQMRDAETADEWIQALDNVINDLSFRFEKKSNIHIDNKTGTGQLVTKHFKQRRVVEALKMADEGDAYRPRGYSNYSIRATKSLLNSPVYRAIKDFPQTTLNTLDLNQTAMAIDDWMQFIGTPTKFRNAMQDKLVSMIEEFNLRQSIADEFAEGKIGPVDLAAYAKQFGTEVDLTKGPSIVQIRSRIQNMLMGSNKVHGLTYPTKVSVDPKTGKEIIEETAQHTLFGWFDDWAEKKGLPPMALKLAQKAVANTNEGQRLYLVDRFGKSEIFASNMTKKGTDVILRNTPQETLEALPTASKLTEYLTYAITMPDPRELSRYIGNVRNGFKFLGQAAVKGGLSKADPDVVADILRFSVDKRGDAVETAAKSVIGRAAKATRNSLKFKITDDGIEEAVLLRLLNKYMTKIWKPAALLRFAWTLRVVGEEQMRMWADDLDNVFTSPLSYFSYWFGDNAPMKTLAGNMQNAVKYKAAMSKGHGGFIGINNYAKNRFMTTVGKSDNRYGSAWGNNVLSYTNDALGEDIFTHAADLYGKTIDYDVANIIFQTTDYPLSRRNINKLLGPDESATIDKTVKDFLFDLNDGIVTNPGLVGETVARYIRQELDIFTQGMMQNTGETFNPNKLINKMIRMSEKDFYKRFGRVAGQPLPPDVTKNKVLNELRRALGDYTRSNLVQTKSLPITNVDERLMFQFDKVLGGDTNVIKGNGKVGDIVAIPNKKGELNYFIVDRVDTVKQKVLTDEEFAMDIGMAQEMLETAGYTTSEANQLLGAARAGKGKLTAAQKKQVKGNINDLITYISINSPVTRINVGKAAGKTRLVIEEGVFNLKDDFVDFKALDLGPIDTKDKAALKELNYMAANQALQNAKEILFYGFRKTKAGKTAKGRKGTFFRATTIVEGGVEKTNIRPTKLGNKVIELGLVKNADELVLFAKNGSGITNQAIDALDAAVTRYVDEGVKLKTVEDITESMVDRVVAQDKFINTQLDALLRQEQFLTLRPTSRASFNFVEDLNENKVARIISGGQTGADIAGLRVAKDLDIPTGGTLPIGHFTEDGANYGLQGRYGLQPDEIPFDDFDLGTAGIIYKKKTGNVIWDNDKKAWTETVDGEVRELTLKEDFSRIRALAYRSRAIKNVDDANVTIIVTRAGADSVGTKSTFMYATRGKWGFGGEKHPYLYTGTDLEFPERAGHKIFTVRTSNASTSYSKNKDVIVINLDKFEADGLKIDPQTQLAIDNVLSYYDNPVVNIAGPSETKMTPVMSSKGLDKIPNKRQYQQDVIDAVPANSPEKIAGAKKGIGGLKKRYDEETKQYLAVEKGLQAALKSMTKGSRADYSGIKITIPFENKISFRDTTVVKGKAGDIVVDAREVTPGLNEAIAELKKTWVIKDRTGRTIRKLNKEELFVAERELKVANAIFKQKSQTWDDIQEAQKIIDSQGVLLPFDQTMRLVLEDSDLYRPFELAVRTALYSALQGTTKTRAAQSFDELVKLYTGPRREYFNDLASDAFDNAQAIKAKVASSDILIESQLKSYLADIHMLAGGDYDVILRNVNDPKYNLNLSMNKTILRNKKDPSFSKEVSGINQLDEPVTINIDGQKQTFKNVDDLLKNNSDFYYDFAPTKSIPTNPTGNKKYASLEEMYDDGYYFDYNITRLGNQDLLRVFAGVDEFKVNYKGQVWKKKLSVNMSDADRKAFFKWLNTQQNHGPARVKAMARPTEIMKDDFNRGFDQAIENLFDTFMSGPTNMFSRSPAFMQYYLDKIRQLARYADQRTKKQIAANFENAWDITLNENIDVGIVRKIFDARKKKWFDKEYKEDFLKELTIDKFDDVIDLNDIPANRKYNMDFNMAPSDNIYRETTTTMDLVLDGRRKSTTRNWGDNLPEKGELIYFKDKNGNQTIVKVKQVNSWEEIKKSPKLLKAWSDQEGWTMAYGLKKAFFNKYDPKTVHQVVFEQYTDKVYTTFKEIDEIAKAYALEETKRLLYDLDKRGQITDALRLVFPFGEAYKEILTTQFRLMKNNPQKLRKATLAIEGAREDSIFGSDPNNNEGFFAKDPLTGEEMYNFADPGGIISGLVVGDTVENSSVRLNLKGYTRNLNMMTTTILPGVGPLVQIPASLFSSATEFTKMGDLLFPYGRPEVRAGLAGVLDIPKAIAAASIPSYMKKLLSSVSPNPSGLGMPDKLDVGSDPAGALASTTKDILKVRAYAGTADFSTLEAQNDEIKSAVRAARGLTFIRAAVQFIWFTGAEPRYEQSISPKGTATIGGKEVSVSDIMFLDPSKTKDIDPEGTLVGFNQLVQSYYRLYEMAHESIRNNPEMADQDPQFIATQAFMTLYGSNPVPLLIRKTREIREYPLGESGLEWARDNKELFKSYPNTATFAKPYEPFDEFDINSWRESITKGARVSLTPAQWIHLNNQANGRIAYQYVNNEVNNNPNFTYWTQMQKNTYLSSMKYLLMDLYPGFGSELTAAGPTDLGTKLRELRSWNKNETLRNSDVGKTLQQYFDYRDELMAFYKLQTGSTLSTIESSNAIAIRNALRLFANQLIIQTPEFRYVYNSILSRELEEDERSVPDGFRILGQ